MIGFSKSAVLLTALQCLALASPVRRQTADDRFMFSFGDSYTTSSFDVNGVQPNPANPMGNPAIGQGTFAGGVNYIGWLTVNRNTTLTYTFDFGFGGATVDNSISGNGNIPSFSDQVGNLYQPNYASGPPDVAPWNPANTFFTVFFGINDIQLNYRSGPIDPVMTQTQQRYFQLLQSLYDTGGRKFVLVNVPPLGRSPQTIEDDPSGVDLWNQWAQEYNRRLAANAQQFAASHGDAQIAVYDLYSFMNGVLDNPQGAGFQDATCVGDGVNCVWQDRFHPTYTFDFLWSGDMVTTMRQVGW